jgi:hypothetical protein
MTEVLPVVPREPPARGFRVDITTGTSPDPWHGHFSRMQRRRVREAIGLAPDAVLVTANLDRLLGDDALSERDVMERLVQMPCGHFVLHGSIWTLRSAWFRQLAKCHGKRLIYAGASRKVYEDIRLIAATDLLLDEPGETALFAGDTRFMRTMALGSAFDRDVRRLLLDRVGALGEMPYATGKLMRDELDRLADKRLKAAAADQRCRDDVFRSCQQRNPNRGTSP